MPMRASTSSGGRRQLSEEKANSVRMPTPRFGRRLHHAAHRLHPGLVSGDARQAAARAQRPLPSMMIPAV